MSNEVAVITPPAQRPMVAAGVRPQALVPSDIEGVWRVAGMLATSGMTPKDINTPEKVSVAIMHGLEIGLTPMQAVQSIAVVNGRPTIWGDAALALVRASGLMESFTEKIVGEGDKMEAICTCVRKGEKEPIVGRFSVDDARTSGLWTKTGYNGAKTPWQLYPKRMLQVRARGFALRDGFADVLKGLAIKEEMDDVQRLEDAPPARAIAPPPPPEIIEPSPTTSPGPSESHAEGNAAGHPTAGEQPYAHEPEAETDWETLLEQFEAGLAKTTGQDAASGMLDYFLSLDQMPRDIAARAETICQNHLDAQQAAHEKDQAKLAEKESAQKGAEGKATETETSKADQSPSPATQAPPPPPDDDFPGDKPSKAATKPPADAEPSHAEKDIALAAQRDQAAIVRVMARKKAAEGKKKFNRWYNTISEADAAIVDAMPDMDQLTEIAAAVDSGASAG